MSGEQASSGPVTMIVSRLVKPGRDADYEQWMAGIIRAAQRFPGYMGTDVIRPQDPGDREHVVVLRFDSYEHLKAWARSEEREAWLARAEPLVRGRENVRVLTGLEAWFTLPGSARTLPPARYKMMLLTGAALYPLILLSNALLVPLLAPLPAALATLVSTMTLVALMTYVVMPRVTRVFSGWLYPQPTPDE